MKRPLGSSSYYPILEHFFQLAEGIAESFNADCNVTSCHDSNLRLLAVKN